MNVSQNAETNLTMSAFQRVQLFTTIHCNYMYVQYLITDLDVLQTVFVFTVQVHYQQPYSNKLIIWPLIIINGCFVWSSFLKALDTFGNCQRPVFSFGVSQHMNKRTNLWTFELNWSWKLWEMVESTLVAQNVCFYMLECKNSADQVSNSIKMF